MIIALFLPVIPKTKKTIKPECAQIFRNPSYVAISKETTKNCTIPATYKSLRTIYKENKE